MSDLRVLQVMEVAGVDKATAEGLLEAAGQDVDRAVVIFFDGADTMAQPAPPQPEPSEHVASTLGLAVPAHPSAVAPQAADLPHDGPTIPVRLHRAWHNDVIDVDAPVNATVLDFKRQIAKQVGVSSVVQRLLRGGQNLQNEATVGSQLGTDPRKVIELALLAPNNDERGDVAIKDSAGKQVLLLREGEWNVNTSVTTLRPVVAKAMQAADVTLVFNGLTLHDGTTFGQCGVCCGSTLTVFKEAGGARPRK